MTLGAEATRAAINRMNHARRSISGSMGLSGLRSTLPGSVEFCRAYLHASKARWFFGTLALAIRRPNGCASNFSAGAGARQDR
jgi:hypothetical protein